MRARDLPKPSATAATASVEQVTASGSKLMHDAEHTAAALEAEVASRLSASETKTLLRLLQKIYL